MVDKRTPCLHCPCNKACLGECFDTIAKLLTAPSSLAINLIGGVELDVYSNDHSEKTALNRDFNPNQCFIDHKRTWGEYNELYRCEDHKV